MRSCSEMFEQYGSNAADCHYGCSIIKGWAANTWLVLMDHTMSANVEIQAQRYAKEHLLTLVNLFYESLDAEKSGKEVSMLFRKRCFLFESYWSLPTVLNHKNIL